jgi:Matrixin
VASSVRHGHARVRARFEILFVMAVGLMLPENALAFCRTSTVKSSAACSMAGMPIFWRNRCVGYSIQRNASRTISFDVASKIVSSAFSKWAQVDCPTAEGTEGSARVSIDIRDLGEVSCEAVRYDPAGENQNVILFRDDTWPHNDKDDVLGLTTVTFSKTTGEIFDADMEINTFDRTISTDEKVAPNGYDLESIVTHEAGHFLGLAHSNNAQSTMDPGYNPGESKKRYLKLDDVLGLCSAYLPDGSRVTSKGSEPAGPTCNPLPRRGIQRTCPDTGCALNPAQRENGTPGLYALLLCISIAQRLRRQRLYARSK